MFNKKKNCPTHAYDLGLCSWKIVQSWRYILILFVMTVDL